MSNGPTIVSRLLLCVPCQSSMGRMVLSAELAIWGTCKGFGMHVWYIVGTGMRYMVGSRLPS